MEVVTTGPIKNGSRSRDIKRGKKGRKGGAFNQTWIKKNRRGEKERYIYIYKIYIYIYKRERGRRKKKSLLFSRRLFSTSILR